MSEERILKKFKTVVSKPMTKKVQKQILTQLFDEPTMEKLWNRIEEVREAKLKRNKMDAHSIGLPLSPIHV